MLFSKYFKVDLENLTFSFTWYDVLVVHSDVSVSVKAGLLMMEAQSVKEFMLHDARFHAAIGIQEDVLSPSLTTDRRPTSDVHRVNL